MTELVPSLIVNALIRSELGWTPVQVSSRIGCLRRHEIISPREVAPDGRLRWRATDALRLVVLLRARWVDQWSYPMLRLLKAALTEWSEESGPDAEIAECVLDIEAKQRLVLLRPRFPEAAGEIPPGTVRIARTELVDREVARENLADPAFAKRWTDFKPDINSPIVMRYVRHVRDGMKMAWLAKEIGCPRSTILRQMRRVELWRDDPEFDATLEELIGSAG